MKKVSLFVTGLITLASCLSLNANPISSRVITLPCPEGGIEALCSQVHYPEFAQESRLEGSVVLRFRVDEFGTISSIVVVRSGGYCFDQAAISAVKSTHWIPATHNSQNISVLFELPFRFCFK